MRLHFGASRIQLADPGAEALRTDDWIHLGEPEPIRQPGSVQTPSNADQPETLGTWLCFYYKRGNVLPFPNDHFSFGFSEHFFEHLFLDEACELLKECYRVMQPGACLRTAVPDADLRSYIDPEPAGFTTGDGRWYHPDKHKSRWSIYSLPYVLEQIGFQTRGIVYCDKFGHHHIQAPGIAEPFYWDCLDQQIVMRTDYIRRCHNSLIVDAVKPR